MSYVLRGLAVSLGLTFSFSAALPAHAEIVFSTSNSPHIDLGEEVEGGATRLDRNLASLLGATAPRVEPTRGMSLSTALSSRKLRGGREMEYSRVFIAAQPDPEGDAQWRCLTEALYFEARGESVKGMFAVAEVILNRVDSSRFPSNVCKVVNQGTGRKYQCQFTYTCDGNAEVVGDAASWRRVGKVARVMLDGAGRPLTDGALYYHTKQVAPRWSKTFDRTATIGAHHFYSQG